MSEGEQKKEEAPTSSSDNPLGLSSDEEPKKWYEKPEDMGNAVGDTIQGGLAPVGNVVGKGLETITKPIGHGLIEPTVGTIMRGGEAFGTQANVGFGNKEGGPAKQAEAEGKRMKEPVGGKEQDGENPLGL